MPETSEVLRRQAKELFFAAKQRSYDARNKALDRYIIAALLLFSGAVWLTPLIIVPLPDTLGTKITIVILLISDASIFAAMIVALVAAIKSQRLALKFTEEAEEHRSRLINRA